MMNQNDAFSFEKAEDSPGFLLWQVTTLWQRGIKKALLQADLTHPQFVLLASLLWLTGRQAAVMQVHLSDHSQMDPMTTSAVLRTLERKLLVTRGPHPSDTRAKVIVLTDAGRAKTKDAIKLIEGFDHSFFSCLGSDTPKLNALLLALAGGTNDAQAT